MRLVDARTALQRRRADRSYSATALNGFLNEGRRFISGYARWSWQLRGWSFSTTPTDATVTDLNVTLGSRLATVTAVPPLTVFGKRILVGNRLLRVVNLSADGKTWTFDQVWPDATATAQTATILYDELALPRDTESIVECSLLETASSPRPLRAASASEAMGWYPTSFGTPYDFAVIRREPIPSPDAAPSPVESASGSGPANGVYLYWTSHYDKQSGAESALSPPATLTQAAGKAVTVTLPQRRDLLLRVYRSKVGGSVPYFIGQTETFAVSSISDTTLDNYLGPRGPDSASSVFLRLNYPPNSVYQLQAVTVVRDVDLADDDDYPPFDSAYDGTWLDLAEAAMLDAADEQGRAGTARARAVDALRRMKAMDSPNQAKRVSIGGRTRLSGVRSWPDIVQ